jgi:fructose-1-phosphate kinase PfkB-like protein
MPELAELGVQAGVAAGTTPQAAARALARHTGGPVIVTMGADGALLADGHATEHFTELLAAGGQASRTQPS